MFAPRTAPPTPSLALQIAPPTFHPITAEESQDLPPPPVQNLPPSPAPSTVAHCKKYLVKSVTCTALGTGIYRLHVHLGRFTVGGFLCKRLRQQSELCDKLFCPASSQKQPNLTPCSFLISSQNAGPTIRRPRCATD